MRLGARRARTRRLIRAAAACLALVATEAAAQTSAPGVPAQRPDQNPRSRSGRQPVIPQPAAERNPDKPLPPFTLGAVRIEGSSLAPGVLSAAYAPFVGRRMDNKALTELTNAVAAAYAKSDIALYTVLVPEQGFADGTVRLRAVEGYVASVEVRGKLRAVRAPLLKAYLRRIERERPLHKATLERMVSLIRDMPGLYPDFSFLKGTTEGAVKLVIQAREKPVQAAFGINDRGTALLGKTQVQADAYLNGILSGADQLHGTIAAPTKTSRFQFYALSYLTPLDADGATLQANASYLRTRPSIYPLKGDATAFGLQLSRPLLRGYRRNLYATLGVDGVDSNNALFGFTLSNDRVRAARLALAYSATTARNQLSLSVTGSQGLAVLGARVVDGQAERGFRKVNAKVNENHQIGRDFVVRLEGFAQLTGDDLPSSEQLTLGGDEFGRAYEAAIVSGDSGYAGSAEVAWRPQKGLPKALAGSELYGVFDGGKVRYRNRFGFDATDTHLKSYGGGGRLQFSNRSVFQLEAIRGLDNPVFYEDRKKWRLLFSVRTVL